MNSDSSGPTEPNPEISYIHGDPDIEDNIDENVTDTDSFALERRKEYISKEEESPVKKLYNNLTVAAAVCMGLLVSIVKFVAAVMTGSAAMFSEGIHSLVDAANDSLLLIGTKASKKPPTLQHPFGYGRLLYFYTFVVSLVIFFFGGGFVIIQGIQSFMAGGNELTNPLIAIVVLVIGILLESVSLAIALKDVNNARGELSIASYIKESKAPTNFTVLLEDTAAVLGMVIALVGIVLSDLLGIPQIDSIASIIIGVIMAVVALILLKETRSLLIGEGLGLKAIENVEFIVESDPAVIKCGQILSMYMSPDDLILTLDVTFDDELDEGDILQAIDRIEEEIAEEYPQCTSIFIEAESLNHVYRQRYDRRKAIAQLEEEEE